MTLKHRNEFATDCQWKKVDTLNGCKMLFLFAVNELSLIEPFNSGLEREALKEFKDRFIKKLERLVPGLDHGNTPGGIETLLSFEVDALVRRLQHVELVNKVYCILMAVCGLIVGLLAAAPLGIPLFFSPVRNYIGSFFSSPKVSVTQFQEHMNAAMNQLHKVLSHEIEVEYFIDANNQPVACFNNVSI